MFKSTFIPSRDHYLSGITAADNLDLHHHPSLATLSLNSDLFQAIILAEDHSKYGSSQLLHRQDIAFPELARRFVPCYRHSLLPCVLPSLFESIRPVDEAVL